MANDVNEMIKVDEQALADALTESAVAVPEETFKMDWKSAGVGFAIACGIAAAIYGGKIVYDKYKAKKAEEKEA